MWIRTSDGLQPTPLVRTMTNSLMDDSLGDPRKGPLFAIVHALLKEEQEDKQ